MKQIRKYWKLFSYQGVQEVNALSDAGRIILTNQISITVLLFSFLSTFLFYLLSLPILWNFLTFFIGLLLYCIYLNSKFYTHLASFLLIVALSIALFYLACSFGSESEVHLLFIPVILACGLLYNFNERDTLLVSVLIPL